MENNNKIKFDPGFAPIIMNSIGQAGYAYYMFNAIPNIKLKKLQFPSTLTKIEKFLKTHLAFYLGCLMWAIYIKQFDNYEIEGNKLLGEVCEEKEYTQELDFLIELIEKQLPRDSKYFLNKPYNPNEKYLPIIKTYREFLVLNKGFVNCSNTNQIVIPDNLKQENLNLIYEKINTAINNKNIDELLDSFELIF